MSVILNIEGIEFEKSNVTFVNGMSLEKVKIKYNWLLNAKVKDAVIGENDRGIVWYFGDWYCGEWEDGTWYSGNFYNGIWKNGLFYSYQLDKFDVLNEIFSIKQVGNQYSTFHNGIWVTGIFGSGTFGLSGTTEDWREFILYDANYEGYEYPNFKKAVSTIGGAIQYEEKNVAVWLDGIFQNGEFYNSIWKNGRHSSGNMTNSKWLDGYWFNGTFNGDTWYNGFWYNGNFIKGDWLNGTFSQLNRSLVSRFGNTTLDTDNNSAICNWYNGVWKGGEWFSGYVTDDSGNPIESSKNYLSVWHDGTWENGIWYGGHFKMGTWENGLWKNGIFGYIKATDWTSPIYVSQTDLRLDYKWSGNTEIPIQTKTSINVNTLNSSNTYYELSHFIEEIDIDIISVTAATSAFTFTQSNIVSFQFDKLDTMYNTSVTNYYDFGEIDFYIGGNEFSPVSITNIGLGMWNAVVYTNGLPISLGPQKVYVRRNVKLDKFDGTTPYSYWHYTNIYAGTYTEPSVPITGGSGFMAIPLPTTYNVVTFAGIGTHDFKPGDYVYIEQDQGYTNPSYNGISYVLSTGATSVTVAKKYKTNAPTNSGKLVKYVGIMSHRINVTSSILSFQDFDFDYDFVTDIQNTLVNGYAIRFKTQVLKDNSYRTAYKNITAMLPLKDLVFAGFDNSDNKEYDIINDTCYYTPSLYSTGNINYPNIPIGKTKIISLDSYNDWYFGGVDDMWGLVDNQGNGLELYYDDTETFFNLDLYNPKILSTAKNRLRVSLSFDLDLVVTQQLRISDIEVKVFYSNESNIPIWRNGTWHKGTWYNGDFYNGNYLSGMWIKGNFYGGNLSSDYR